MQVDRSENTRGVECINSSYYYVLLTNGETEIWRVVALGNGKHRISGNKMIAMMNNGEAMGLDDIMMEASR